MALSLGLFKDEKFYVGDEAITVLDIQGHTFALLKVKDKVVKVDDQKSVEILPRVFVSCGRPSNSRITKHAKVVADYHAEVSRRNDLPHSDLKKLPPLALPPELLPRLIFEAPREITILREALYVRDKKSD